MSTTATPTPAPRPPINYPATALQAQVKAAAAADVSSADAHSALRAERAAGAEAFAASGLPTRRVEDWHYTSVAAIAETDFTPMTGDASGVTAEQLSPYLFAPAWPVLVFVNGVYAPQLSRTDVLPAGIQVLPMADAVRELGDVVARQLGTSAPAGRDGFTALNASFLGEGAVVHVAKEMVIDTPVHLLFVATDAARGGMQHPRVLLLAERHAKATVVESWVGLTDAPYFTNAVAEVVVEDGATLHHVKVQREGAGAYHVGTIEARQGRDSHYINFSFAVGAALSRTNVYTVLGGEGCGTTLNGLYMFDGSQHGDHQTRIEHATPSCFSRQIYKGILDGESHGVFNGKVFVRAIAQQTDGKQTNNTLLLSDRAQIDAKPQLEIFADDVKCTHGATVGQLDATALFYLKSRGIDAHTAQQLLTYAFAADVLETIENEAIRVELERITRLRFTEAEG